MSISYQIADRANCRDIALLFFRNLPTSHTTLQECVHNIEQIVNSNHQYAFIAIDKTKNLLVGYLNISLMQRPRGGVIGYVGEVLVDGHYRRRSIGLNLIKITKKKAKELGCLSLILHCDDSLMRFYEYNEFIAWERGMILKI